MNTNVDIEKEEKGLRMRRFGIAKNITVFFALFLATLFIGCKDEKEKINKAVEKAKEVKMEVCKVVEEKVPLITDFAKLTEKELAQIAKDVISGKLSLLKTVEEVEHVEVSPGKFIPIKSIVECFNDELYLALSHYDLRRVEDNESSEIIVPYGGHEIHWEGYPIPTSLRDYKGTMYMVAYHRGKGFVYYKQDKDVFKAISSKEYPKEIVVQNMWISKREIEDGTIEATVNFDTGSLDFIHSTTAHMWYELMMSDEVTKEFCINCNDDMRTIIEAYIDKYKPIKLTKIVYDETQAEN